jgi:hypothetical protein
MPHLRCLGCGVVSYAPAGGSGTCPECGIPWPPRPDRVVQSADPEQRLGALVRMTRDLLDVDLALLTEIDSGRETVRLAAGGWDGMSLRRGDWLPLEETFCRLMLEGRIGNVVRDAPAEPAVADIDFVRRLGTRAYLGVPIRPSDAELYVLCCASSHVRADRMSAGTIVWSASDSWYSTAAPAALSRSRAERPKPTSITRSARPWAISTGSPSTAAGEGAQSSSTGMKPEKMSRPPGVGREPSSPSA